MNGDNEIASILRKFGTSLSETRAMMPELLTAAERQREQRQAVLEAPQLFTATEAKEMGVDLEEGWMLKVTPPLNGAEPTISFITPEKWEILEDQTYVSPEGQHFTQEELQAQLETPEIPLEIEQVFGRVFPDRSIMETLEWLEESEENIGQFLSTIQQAGRTKDTEALLKTLFPEITEEDIDELFAPAPELGITEIAGEIWGQTPWAAPPAEWSEAVKGFPGLMDIMQWLAPTKLGAGLGVVGAYIEKYVGRPWEVALLEMRARARISSPFVEDTETELDKLVIQRIEAAFAQYGAGAIFSEEIGLAFQEYEEQLEGAPGVALEVMEWLNPIYWVPIGGTFGKVAGWTSRIPVIGRGMRYAAAGVQATERGILYPVTKPMELGLRGFEWVGERLGEQMMNRLIRQSAHLVAIEDLIKVTDKEILDGLLVDNWMKRTLILASKIPPIKVGIERALGWRILIRRQGQAIEDIVGQGAVIHSYFQRMGINVKNPIVYSLRAIEANPIKYFGFNKQAFSGKMLKRLLPEYAGAANAGTLEHIFTRPEMYSWAGMERGLEYVARVNNINREILTLLNKEGIPPAHVVEDWIHRVVISEGKRLRRGGWAVGAKQPFERPRQFETMAEGIEWFNKHPELGAHYASNPEIAVAEYVEEAFKKIADERFVKYLAQFGEIGGIKPSERLLELYPELAQRAILRAEELADAKRFSDLINQAMRGEKIPAQTLAAIERRFPEHGRIFRTLVEQPSTIEKELRVLLKDNENLIRNLQTRLEKAEAIDLAAIRAEAKLEAGLAIPDERKLVEAFRVMEYEDRLAFRSTMEAQLDDVSRLVVEQEAELAGLKEWLAGERAVAYINILAKSGWYKGEIRYLTVKQYRLLTGAVWVTQRTKEGRIVRVLSGGRQPTQGMMTPEGKVRWEYALDSIATEQGYASGEAFKEAIEKALETKTTIEDLTALVKMADSRYQGIRRMLALLDDVESTSAYVARPQPSPLQEITPPEVPAAGVVREIKYRSGLGGTIKETEAEALARIEQLKADIALTNRRLERLRITQQKNPGWKAYDALAEDFVGIDIRIEEQQAVLGMMKEELANIQAALEKLPPRPVAEAIPKAEPGMPEAGLKKDLFGYETPYYPKGRGEITQMSLDDWNKWMEWCKREGIPIRDTAIKPKVEGIAALEAETQIRRVRYKIPDIKTVAERRAGLTALRNEIKTLIEARKQPFWQSRAERALRMEQLRQPGLEEGYVLQPFAGGKIYGQEFIDAFNKFFGHDAGLGVLKVTSDIAGILRITKAALDFSMQAIQGLPSWGLAHAYLLTNPAIGVRLMGSWYKAFWQSIGIFFDPNILARAIDNKMAIGMQRIAMGGSSRAVDYFAALQARKGLGGLAERAMERMPWKPYHRAEAAFYGAGEMIRNDFWEILSKKAIASGKEFELARFLDRITGLTDAGALGVPLTVRQLEQSFAWFAPNYTRACLTELADIFRGGYTGAMTRKALGGMISAGALMYSAIQYGLASLEDKSHEEALDVVKEGFGIREDPITGEATWKPTGRFMTIKIGNYYFGFGGFWYGLLRLSGNIMACVNEVGEKETIDLIRIIKHGSFNKQDNPFIYWWFSRASPFFGAGFELATGRDFLGYPIETPVEYAKYIATRFEPIWMEQGLNWLVPGMARDNEIPEGMARAAVVPAELFGLRTFPESGWVRFYDKADEYIHRIPEDELDPKQLEAWRNGELGWEHLTDIQRANLLSRYPDLEELYGTAQADSAIRNSPHWQAWQGRMDEERSIYYQRVEDLTQRLLNGEIDTTEYRELAGEAGMNYGSILEAIERDPAYAEIYDYFDKKEAEGDDYGFYDDLALAEFQSLIIYAEDLTDAKGDYDWDERDRRIDAFIEKWGQDTYDRIQQYLSQEKGLKGLNVIWIRKAQDTEKLGRTYWRLPYKPISEMDEADEVEGNIPAEYYTLWKAYQALGTEAEQETFLLQHPELAKDWRAEYRKENPEADAMLALWGYGGKLQSIEAYNLVEQWSRELGIPLEQMGLGLPPRSLLESYFGYLDVSRLSGGNSAEAKLWRLEHPEFNNWAMENWGWGSTQDYKGMEYYQLQIKWRTEQAEYDALDSKEAREEYLASHMEFRDDRRRMQAMDYEFPEDLIDTYIEYYALTPKSQSSWHQDNPSEPYYEDEWFLLDHLEFYQAMLELGIWTKKIDFTKVPTREVFELYKTWLGLPKGQERRDFEAANPDLDMWLHITRGTKLESEKNGGGATGGQSSPWEELERKKRQIEAIQGLFD